MRVELVPDTFSGHIGTSFTATPTFAGEPLELVLSECETNPPNPVSDRRPFSLIFRADTPDALPQQIFELAHTEIGEVALFLVPLGPQDGRMRYQAVIS